ncbi:hypothetical protein HDU67_001064 [Dinochytrium kinnereticum]|nr:hypothetical protein HDU67_001064 [Dinochytrium kinnereticum]
MSDGEGGERDEEDSIDTLLISPRGRKEVGSALPRWNDAVSMFWFDEDGEHAGRDPLLDLSVRGDARYERPVPNASAFQMEVPLALWDVESESATPVRNVSTFSFQSVAGLEGEHTDPSAMINANKCGEGLELREVFVSSTKTGTPSDLEDRVRLSPQKASLPVVSDNPRRSPRTKSPDAAHPEVVNPFEDKISTPFESSLVAGKGAVPVMRLTRSLSKASDVLEHEGERDVTPNQPIAQEGIVPLRQGRRSKSIPKAVEASAPNMESRRSKRRSASSQPEEEPTVTSGPSGDGNIEGNDETPRRRSGRPKSVVKDVDSASLELRRLSLRSAGGPRIDGESSVTPRTLNPGEDKDATPRRGRGRPKSATKTVENIAPVMETRASARRLSVGTEAVDESTVSPDTPDGQGHVATLRRGRGRPKSATKTTENTTAVMETRGSARRLSVGLQAVDESTVSPDRSDDGDRNSATRRIGSGSPKSIARDVDDVAACTELRRSSLRSAVGPRIDTESSVTPDPQNNGNRKDATPQRGRGRPKSARKVVGDVAASTELRHSSLRSAVRLQAEDEPSVTPDLLNNRNLEKATPQRVPKVSKSTTRNSYGASPTTESRRSLRGKSAPLENESRVDLGQLTGSDRQDAPSGRGRPTPGTGAVKDGPTVLELRRSTRRSSASIEGELSIMSEVKHAGGGKKDAMQLRESGRLKNIPNTGDGVNVSFEAVDAGDGSGTGNQPPEVLYVNPLEQMSLVAGENEPGIAGLGVASSAETNGAFKPVEVLVAKAAERPSRRPSTLSFKPLLSEILLPTVTPQLFGTPSVTLKNRFPDYTSQRPLLEKIHTLVSVEKNVTLTNKSDEGSWGSIAGDTDASLVSSSPNLDSTESTTHKTRTLKRSFDESLQGVSDSSHPHRRGSSTSSKAFSEGDGKGASAIRKVSSFGRFFGGQRKSRAEDETHTSSTRLGLDEEEVEPLDAIPSESGDMMAHSTVDDWWGAKRVLPGVSLPDKVVTATRELAEVFDPVAEPVRGPMLKRPADLMELMESSQNDGSTPLVIRRRLEKQRSGRVDGVRGGWKPAKGRKRGGEVRIAFGCAGVWSVGKKH